MQPARGGRVAVRDEQAQMLIRSIRAGKVSMTRKAAEEAKKLTGVDPETLGIHVIAEEAAEALPQGYSVHMRCSDTAPAGEAAEKQHCIECAQEIWVGKNLVGVKLPRICTHCMGKETAQHGDWKH